MTATGDPRTVRALIIHPDGSHEHVDIVGRLPVLTQVVAGPIEMISGGTGAWHAYVNEEGKIDGLELNPIATSLAYALGWPKGDAIVGSAVFLGMDDDGAEADVPDEVVRTFASFSN